MLASVNTVIPIQGTFDIARGRNSLRTHIAAHHWPTSFNMRAGALLTAVGELILTIAPGHLIPLNVEMRSSDLGIHLKMACEFHHLRIDENRRYTLEERLKKMADELTFEYQNCNLNIVACLNLSEMR